MIHKISTIKTTITKLNFNKIKIVYYRAVNWLFINNIKFNYKLSNLFSDAKRPILDQRSDLHTPALFESNYVGSCMVLILTRFIRTWPTVIMIILYQYCHCREIPCYIRNPWIKIQCPMCENEYKWIHR